MGLFPLAIRTGATLEFSYSSDDRQVGDSDFRSSPTLRETVGVRHQLESSVRLADSNPNPRLRQTNRTQLQEDQLNTMYPQTGRGVGGFMNASSFLPLTVARTVPLSFLGAGVLRLHEG